MTDVARRVALDVLVRIDTEGAYANVVLPKTLAGTDLDARDRGFVTELVYGTTRKRRALDWVIDPFLVKDPPPVARAALRLGAYQLLELDTPAHAAVSETVAASPKRFRGLANAVLRKISSVTPQWPNDATRLSYTDWIVARLSADLGEEAALAALESMNRPATVHRREDGYVQDPSSLLVADAVDVGPHDLVYDMCAAPGGKATALAQRGATVIAGELNLARAGLVSTNRESLGAATLSVVAADGMRPPVRAGAFDAVLIDAPCTGLGALRRRPDARWRIDEAAVDRLVKLQRSLIGAAVPLLKPGGQLVYSVCTLTSAETIGVAEWVGENTDLVVDERLGLPWTSHAVGALLLPAEANDGMAVFRWRAPGHESAGDGIVTP